MKPLNESCNKDQKITEKVEMAGNSKSCCIKARKRQKEQFGGL